MTIARTALRLAAVEALAPHGASVFPTMAGRRIYDSRFAPIDDLALHERRPVACVYTEGDDGDPIDRTGTAAMRRVVDLVVELSVPQVAEDDGAFVVGYPITDREIELSLDLLEDQVRAVLTRGATGALFRRCIARWLGINSHPARTAEEAVRLGMRTLTFRLEIVEGCPPMPPDPEATGLARLPEPARSVAEGLPAGSDGLAVMTAIAAAWSEPFAAQPFGGINFAFDLAPPGGLPADGAPDAEAPVDFAEEDSDD